MSFARSSTNIRKLGTSPSPRGGTLHLTSEGLEEMFEISARFDGGTSNTVKSAQTGSRNPHRQFKKKVRKVKAPTHVRALNMNLIDQK